MSSLPLGRGTAEVDARISLGPLQDTSTFADRAYAALKDVILSLDIYERRADTRLDERRLAQDLGVSCTSVREAMAQLELEGFVRSVPRRGIYVVRNTKREVIQMITAWAALESMAARLITEHAGDKDIASLRKMFTEFENGELHARLDEYSEVNIEFHQAIVRMRRNGVLIALAENLFTHMRMIRMKSGPTARSVITCTSSKRSRRVIPRAPKSSCAATRSVSPSTSRVMRTTWIDRTMETRGRGETCAA